jgi:uncharacterized protein
VPGARPPPIRDGQADHVHIDALDQLAAGGAAVVAGAVNALAGGGSLISFPTLVGLGVPAVAANVTNTVSLVPGYLSGAWAQRDDLRPQLNQTRSLVAVAGSGGLAGSILLVVLPNHAFRVAVPFLILLACGLLAFGRRLSPARRTPPAPRPRRFLPARRTPPTPPVPSGGPPAPVAVSPTRGHDLAQAASIFACAVYGGFFGAGLGIVLLAVLGLFSDQSLTKLNALKQALSFVTNIVAAAFFVLSGRTVWVLVPVMAIGSLVGGTIGGRLVKVVNADLLRWLVVVSGVAVAILLAVL